MVNKEMSSNMIKSTARLEDDSEGMVEDFSNKERFETENSVAMDEYVVEDSNLTDEGEDNDNHSGIRMSEEEENNQITYHGLSKRDENIESCDDEESNYWTGSEGL